jgi:hypothetical protein
MDNDASSETDSPMETLVVHCLPRAVRKGNWRNDALLVVPPLFRPGLLLFALLFTGHAFSAAPVPDGTVRFVSKWPPYPAGPSRSIIWTNDLLYVSVDNLSLQVFDARNVANLRPLGTIQLGDEVYTLGPAPLVMSGPYAYLGQEGLKIIDVSNPTDPAIMGSWDTYAVRGMALYSNYVYLSSVTNWLSVLEISNPGSPKVLYRSSTNAAHSNISLTSAGVMMVTGEYLYIASILGMEIYSLRDPRSPQFIRSISAPFQSDMQEMTQWRNKLIVPLRDRIVILDISDPENPVVQNEVLARDPATPAVYHVLVRGDYLYTGRAETLAVLDLSALPQERVTSERDLGIVEDLFYLFFGLFNGGGVQGLASSGDQLLLSRGADGLDFFDISNPEIPLRGAHHDTYSDIRNVAVSGNYAYVMNFPRGIEMVDISVPSQPKLVGLQPFAMSLQANDTLKADGSRVFATDSIHGLTLIDFKTPSAPAVTRFPSAYPERAVNSLILTPGFLFRTEKVWSQILPGVNTRELYYWFYIHNLENLISTNPSPPIRLGTNDLFGRPLKCVPFYYSKTQEMRPGPLYWFRGDAFYRLDDDLIAGTLTSPPGISTLRQVLPSVGCYDFAIELTNRVFLASSNGLNCLDFTSNGTPEVLGTLLTNQISGLDGHDHTLAFVDKTGLGVLDVSEARHPRLQGSYNLPFLHYVVTAGRYALTTRGPLGLIILDMGEQTEEAARILRQPRNAFALLGSAARFDVATLGTPPLHYQWYNGTNCFPDATNALLIVTNLFSSSDQIFVTVSNSSGVQTSAVAQLRVDFPPSITLSGFNPGPVVPSGSDLTFTVNWSDPDNLSTRIEIFTSLNPTPLISTQRLGLKPFQLRWPQVPPGTHLLWARATDAFGASAFSATNTVLSTDEPRFFFANLHYRVAETSGPVQIGIGRTGTGNAIVEIHTVEATARAHGAPGGGHFIPIHATLKFGPFDTTRYVELSVINNTTYQGDVWFTLRLTNATPGWRTDFAAEARVDLLEDDDPSQTNFWNEVLGPSPASNALASLSLQLEPSTAFGKWRFLWETKWRDGGEIATHLTPGEYPVVFLPRSGFLAPDSATYFIGPNAHESFTERYIPIATTKSGSLSLTLLPFHVTQGVQRGQWRPQGNVNAPWLDSGAVVSDLPVGFHIVEFKSLAGFIAPQPMLIQVIPDQTIVRKASYLSSPPTVGTLPRPLADPAFFNSALDAGLPHAFAGQLLTDAGFASGVVVKKRTVLTAAHAIFRSDSLSYSSQAWWFFQRHSGQYEPLPLASRGAVLFSGYAVAKSNDVVSGLQPGESSATTLSHDLAALFFFADAGRGGYGGFVVTQPGQEWLLAPSSKLALSYPVEGVPESDVGMLHVAGPGPMTFASALPNLYYTESVHHWPGSSGGPICVPHSTTDGRPMYFTAGLQVGGYGRTIVRAIDLEVTDMINRAEIQSNGGPDSTGGGFISSSFGADGPGRRSGLLTLRVGPPAALRLGGAWRISPARSGERGELVGYTNFTAAVASLPVVSTNFDIELHLLPGFSFPTNQQVRVVEDANILLDLRYTVTPPIFVSDPDRGLGLVGTPGTSYRIETKLQPEDPNWLPLHRIRLDAGTNWLPNVTVEDFTHRLHRAIWLSE